MAIEKIDELGKKVNISFSLDKSFENAAIAVYVYDNAGNKPTKATLNVDDFDAQKPNITSIDIVNISYDDNDVEHNNPIESIQEPHEYGIDNLKNHTNYIYANDNSYLKICVDDDYKQLEIKVTINGSEVILRLKT